MNEYEQANKKYNSDPVFRTIVDMMYTGIAKMDYTPAELRKAAMYAAVKFEMEHTRHIRGYNMQWQAADGEVI